MNHKGFKVDGFHIHLNKTDTDLTIEAENQTNLSQFFTKITSGEVPELSHHLFTNIEEFYEGIRAAFEQSTPEMIKVSMTENGEINFSYKMMIGKLEKIFAFSIKLDEKSVTSTVKLERRIAQLTFRQEEHERVVVEKLDYLSAKIKKLEELTEERLNKYEQAMMLKFQEFSLKLKMPKSYQFDNQLKNSENFDFTNHNKTVTFKASNTWYAVFANEPLVKKNKQKFSIMLNKCTHDSDGIMVGIAPENCRNTDSCTSAIGSTFLYCYNGSVYTSGNNIKKDVARKAVEGSVIQVIVDFNKNQITFKENNVVVNKVQTDCSVSLKDVDFYPCVNLYFKEDSVSFV